MQKISFVRGSKIHIKQITHAWRGAISDVAPESLAVLQRMLGHRATVSSIPAFLCGAERGSVVCFADGLIDTLKNIVTLSNSLCAQVGGPDLPADGETLIRCKRNGAIQSGLSDGPANASPLANRTHREASTTSTEKLAPRHKSTNAAFATCGFQDASRFQHRGVRGEAGSGERVQLQIITFYQ